MFINAISHYMPKTIIGNKHYTHLNGLTDEWIFKRSGIRKRAKANGKENANTMAIEAVRALGRDLPYPLSEIDLIVGATYTPYDTIGTLAHAVQGHFHAPRAVAVTITTACSSFVNAVEIVEGYFALGKAERALVVVSEHNFAYTDDSDKHSGHLWGDGAGAVLISKGRLSSGDIEIIDVHTAGLGHVGKGIDGVFLRPNDGGLQMPHGQDVFARASKFMALEAKDILKRNGLTPKDVDHLIPHQANARIISRVAKTLGLNIDKVVSIIEETGNTGCASTVICLSQNLERFRKDDIIVVTVFGGGYSSGSMLMRK